MTAHKVELSVESASGTPVGSVVVGISEEQFLKLKADFPDIGFSGQNPKVNEAIGDGITETEKKQIAEHLGFLYQNFTLQFKTICRFIDEAKERSSFESNGKKFWTFPAAS
jgi:hypothetical protein